ncbi:hypothetical protein BJ138DRAFT_1131263, partial [Hygrophoropsis aurantiaca]
MLFSLDPRPERNTGIVLQLRHIATGNTVLRRFATTSQVDDAVAKLSKKFEDQFREFDKALAELNANWGTSNFDSLREDDEDEDDEEEEEVSQVPDFLILEIKAMGSEVPKARRPVIIIGRAAASGAGVAISGAEITTTGAGVTAAAAGNTATAAGTAATGLHTRQGTHTAQQDCRLHPVAATYALTGPAAYDCQWTRPTQD